MTAKWHRLAAVLLAVGVCTSVAVLTPAADKKDAKKGDDEDAPNPVIEISTTANKTAEFGRTNKSPEALVAAAIMLRSLKSADTRMVPITEQPTDEHGKPVTDKALALSSFADQSDDLFEEARNMALDLKLEDFDAYINAAKSRQTRAVVGGAKALRRPLAPGRMNVFHFRFQNLKPCEIAIHATRPVHFLVEHAHTHAILANGLGMHGALRDWPHGKPKKTTAVNIKIRNPNRLALVYELYVR